MTENEKRELENAYQRIDDLYRHIKYLHSEKEDLIKQIKELQK